MMWLDFIPPPSLSLSFLSRQNDKFLYCILHTILTIPTATNASKIRKCIDFKSIGIIMIIMFVYYKYARNLNSQMPTAHCPLNNIFHLLFVCIAHSRKLKMLAGYIVDTGDWINLKYDILINIKFIHNILILFTVYSLWPCLLHYEHIVVQCFQCPVSSVYEFANKWLNKWMMSHAKYLSLSETLIECVHTIFMETVQCISEKLLLLNCPRRWTVNIEKGVQRRNMTKTKKKTTTWNQREKRRRLIRTLYRRQHVAIVMSDWIWRPRNLSINAYRTCQYWTEATTVK